MTRTLLALALVLSTLSPTLALAQGEGSSTRTEVFDDADTVTGTYQSPEGEQMWGHRRRVRHTLIQARSHYIPEMLRSVENL
jgi:hypothetical protein